MTARVETHDLAPTTEGGHPTAQLAALPLDAEVVDAHADPSGAVVLTLWPVLHRARTDQVVYLVGERGTPHPDARFVRTVADHDRRLVLHVFVAPVDEQSRRDVEHAARHPRA